MRFAVRQCILQKVFSSTDADPVLTHDPQMVLVMDEVDGMSAGDRGGVQDLIKTIAKSKACQSPCPGHVKHCRP